MKQSRELSDFQDRIGYRFSDPDLLRRALTHNSLASDTRPSNQRLEFLGDRVLNLAIAEALLAQDQSADEGTLAPRYNALVRKETCADVARTMDLGAVLRLGRGEQNTGGRRKNAILGDAMEAVLAAIYLDGGLDAARKVILKHWGDKLINVEAQARDAKTALQEWVQARGEPPPRYVEIARDGPDHAPRFTIAARLASGAEAQAEGGSKREAEQAAADLLLKRLEKQT
ncbi:MAG: ribonuclease III [Paracoccaceae bacterium]